MDKLLEHEVFERRYHELVRDRFLGNAALAGVRQEQLKPYERRHYDEIVSGLSEAIAGRVKTHYQFELDGRGNLTASDSEPTRHMLNRALEDAQELADSDNFYDFAVERTQSELRELDDQEAMAKGRAPFNTIVTFSPYNEELAHDEISKHKLLVAGQMPAWRRSMIRISHWDGQNLHVITRSIDNSNLELLKQTASQSMLAHEFAAKNANQMLAERVTKRHLSLAKAIGLADDIVETADQILRRQYPDQIFKQGRPAEDRDTHAYIESQAPIVIGLLKQAQKLMLEHDNFESYKAQFDKATYNIAALIEARMARGVKEPVDDLMAAASAAGQIAGAENRQYNMCGHVLSRDEQLSLEAQTGFESLMRLAGKKIQCPECKTKVVVDSKDLSAGHLVCDHCGHGVDVCTGRRFNKKLQAQESNKGDKKFDVADAIAAAVAPPKAKTKT